MNNLLPKPGTKVFVKYEHQPNCWFSGVVFDGKPAPANWENVDNKSTGWENVEGMFNVHYGGMNRRFEHKEWNKTVIEVTELTNILYGPWTNKHFNYILLYNSEK